MLNRLLSRRSPLRILTLISLKPHHSLNPNPNSLPLLKNPNPIFSLLRHFSTNHRNNNNNHDRGATSSSDTWRLSPDPDHSTDSIDSIFGKDDEGENIDVTGREEREAGGGWGSEKKKEYGVFDSIGVGGRQEREAGGVWGSAAGRREKHAYDVFEGIDVGGREEREAGGGWGSATGRREKKDYDVFEGIDVGRGEEREGVGERGWRLGGEKGEDDVFGDLEEGEERVEVREDGGREEREAIARKVEEEKKLEEEARVLSNVLKGPNRAFGDLISASGITEEMLDSLLALKDLGGVQGLPPLSEIEDMRYEKNTRKSSRAEIERQKQEEVAKAHVRQVDDKGRAYGTGRRKCSIARVWIQPGEGKFMVNEKEFDVYFPMLDHRAALLRPFSETKTLGLWDVTCTVKGGGTSGQVGAVQLGVSRALQNWEPNLRPPLRAVGFLTRDSRVVERKKPGLAKARKSFQWVKR